MEAVQVFDQPIMIEGEWTGQIRDHGKSNQADAVTGALGDEVFKDRAGNPEAGAAFINAAHVQGHHRPGQIKNEHDIDPASLGLGAIIGETRAGKRNDAEADGKDAQKNEQASRRRARSPASRARDICTRKADPGNLADPSAQKGIDGEEGQQGQHPRILKLEMRIHASLKSSLRSIVYIAKKSEKKERLACLARSRSTAIESSAATLSGLDTLFFCRLI